MPAPPGRGEEEGSPDALSLSAQITLLKYFRNYMSEHLLKAGANITPREGDELARLPYLRTWFRTRSAIVLHLSNGCVQINFFQVSWRQEWSGGRGCLPWASPVTLHLCAPPGPHQTHPVPPDGRSHLHQ